MKQRKHDYGGERWEAGRERNEEETKQRSKEKEKREKQVKKGDRQRMKHRKRDYGEGIEEGRETVGKYRKSRKVKRKKENV